MAGNKLHARRVLYDGHSFPSQLEADRYIELKLLEQAGEISNLVLQPKFILIKKFKHRGRSWRGISITFDFQYQDRAGHTILEDTKGYMTRDFETKMILFLSQNPTANLRILSRQEVGKYSGVRGQG